MIPRFFKFSFKKFFLEIYIFNIIFQKSKEMILDLKKYHVDISMQTKFCYTYTSYVASFKKNDKVITHPGNGGVRIIIGAITI